MKRKTKNEGIKQVKQTWENKALHRWYPWWSQQADADKANTHQRICSVGLKAETEGFIMAVQDQGLLRRNWLVRINGADPKCWMCDQYNEAIDHLVSEYHVIRPNKYKNRHDRVGQYTNWKICQHYRTGMNRNYYLFSKHITTISGGTLQYTLIEKLMLINQILPLKITKTNHVYWLSWCCLWKKLVS